MHNDRDLEKVKDGVVQRGRGADNNEEEGSETERGKAKQGLWGEAIVVNMAERE